MLSDINVPKHAAINKTALEKVFDLGPTGTSPQIEAGVEASSSPLAIRLYCTSKVTYLQVIRGLLSHALPRIVSIGNRLEHGPLQTLRARSFLLRLLGTKQCLASLSS